MGVIETKTFKSGNSVAVRLPKELGFTADVPVTIEKIGATLRVERVEDPAEGKRRVERLVAALRELGPGEVQQREPIEFPERSGL